MRESPSSSWQPDDPSVGSALYQVLLQNSNDAVLVVDSQAQIIEANVSACRLLGYDRDALVQFVWQDLVVTEGQQHALELATLLGSTDQSATCLLRAKNEIVHVALSGGSTSNGLSLVVLRLISRAEHTAPELAVDVERVLQQLPLGVVVASADGQVISSNNHLRSMFRWPDDMPLAPLDNSAWPLFDPYTGEPFLILSLPVISSMQFGETAINNELMIRRGDGTWGMISISSAPVFDDNGNISQSITVFTDITRQCDIEESLRRHTGRLQILANLSETLELDEPRVLAETARILAESSNDACVIFLLDDTSTDLHLAAAHDQKPAAKALLDAFGRVESFAAAALPLASQIIASGKPAHESDFNQAAFRKILLPQDWALLEQTSICDVLAVPLRVREQAIGVLYLLRHRLNQQPFSDDDQAMIEDVANRVGLALSNARLHSQTQQELTERKRAETALRQLNSELEQRVAERTSELESFVYSVAHDLRTPLRAIMGYTNMLNEDHAPNLDSEGQRLCRVVQRETQRMNQLIADLLEFARCGSADIRLTLVDMSMVAQMAWHALNKGDEVPRIRFELGSLPPAVVDPRLIQHVWQNLFDNAIKFTSTRDKAIISVRGWSTDNEHVYEIQDNGVGFDMRQQHRLFGVFQRLHRADEFSGTGVGLAIVQRIVARHGGRTWAQGYIDTGATFYIALPRSNKGS